MQSKLYLKSTFLAIFVFAGCLALAQQSDDPKTTTTTTAKPTPAPMKCEVDPKKPKALVENYHFGTCIVAKLAAHIKLGNNYVNLGNGVVNTTLSKCESKNSTEGQHPVLVVDFDCGQIRIEINKTTTVSPQIYVDSVSGFYMVGKTNQPITFTNSTKLFVTSETGHYYKCDSEQNIGLPAHINETNYLVFSNFAYEAYRTASSQDFYKVVEECSLDAGAFSDGVRWGVGISLVAFVAIILIAYFVGRRRWSQRSSYESV